MSPEVQLRTARVQPASCDIQSCSTEQADTCLKQIRPRVSVVPLAAVPHAPWRPASTGIKSTADVLCGRSNGTASATRDCLQSGEREQHQQQSCRLCLTFKNHGAASTVRSLVLLQSASSSASQQRGSWRRGSGARAEAQVQQAGRLLEASQSLQHATAQANPQQCTA